MEAEFQYNRHIPIIRAALKVYYMLLDSIFTSIGQHHTSAFFMADLFIMPYFIENVNGF